MSKDWNRFVAALRHIIGNFQYIQTTESQENGFSHIHAVIFGKKWLLENGKWSDYEGTKKRKAKNKSFTLESVWKRGFTYVNKRPDGSSVMEPLNYMFKCMESTWDKKELCGKGNITRAMLWFFNRRSYNISQGLQNFLKENSKNEVESIEGHVFKESEIEWLGIVVLYDTIIEKSADLLPYLEEVMNRKTRKHRGAG